MRSFFYNLGYKFRQFMYGRNGVDALNMALLILSLIFSILSNFRALSFMYFFSSLAVVLFVLRFFSKNLYKRQDENAKFLGLKNKFSRQANTAKKMWQDKDTHKYFKCKCGTNLRVPKGKGKIEITCPKCGRKIIKRT